MKNERQKFYNFLKLDHAFIDFLKNNIFYKIFYKKYIYRNIYTYIVFFQKDQFQRLSKVYKNCITIPTLRATIRFLIFKYKKIKFPKLIKNGYIIVLVFCEIYNKIHNKHMDDLFLTISLSKFSFALYLSS